MKTIRTTLALLVGLAVTGPTLTAQAPGSLRMSSATLPAAHSIAKLDEIGARLSHARDLAVNGRWKEAHREYAAVARAQKEAGILADEALWHLALLSSAQGRKLRAAAFMDQLAVEAEKHGHPVVQSRALIEAAVLYKEAGRPEAALARVERLEPLLTSPFLSDADRKAIERRIIRG